MYLHRKWDKFAFRKYTLFSGIRYICIHLNLKSYQNPCYISIPINLLLTSSSDPINRRTSADLTLVYDN